MESSPGQSQISQLLNQHAAALELYAAQWTTTPADCVQEGFIELAARLQRSGEVPEHAVAWLYRVVRNRALNAARAERRRDRYERLAGRLVRRESEHPSADIDASALTKALDKLSESQREIVVLRIWSELTWKQIADLTETSSSSAQRHYVAALTKLRQHLEPSCLPKIV